VDRVAGSNTGPVGIVGIGNIGRGVVSGLQRVGREFVAFDVNPEAGAELGQPFARAQSLAELARTCSVIGVSVFDEAQVRAVITGPDGLLSAGSTGLVIVIISTIAVDAVRDLAVRVTAAGCDLIDAGVTPGSALASGEAVSFVGGDAAAIERAHGLLSAYSGQILHVGAVGAGMAAKIARNLTTYASWRVFFEAAVIAESEGVDIAKLLQGISASNNLFSAVPGGNAGLLLTRRGTTRAVDPDDGAAISGLQFLDATMTKDLLAAKQLAAQHGLELPVLDITLETTRTFLGLPS
jgi:3-hydroxyisobutyrate dehydrogenase-like beta-hydroxyacid dehydrogenase